MGALRSTSWLLETCVESEGLVRAVYADPRFEVFSDSFFKEVRFALETDRLHPFERIANTVVTAISKVDKKSIGTEFNVVAHHI